MPAVAAPGQPVVANPAARLKPSLTGRLNPEWPIPARPSYLRSNEQLHEHLVGLQREFPELVRLEQIGTTAEQRPIWAMRVGAAGAVDAQRGAEALPKLLLVGGVHPRESANPELIVRTLEDLVRGYGTDAAATKLLRTRSLVAVPIANPDGHAAVERGFETGDGDLVFQRRNSSKEGGVDLNRNFDMHWGVTGGSPEPWHQNYRGAAPASERETQALQKFIAAEQPNLYLDMHSRGEVILMPWGHTAEPAKDAAQHRAIATQLAKHNGYEPVTSWEQAPGSGSSKDWVYGKLGVPAFTVETGTTWHQPDAMFADSLKRNGAMIRHAAELAGAAPSA